ncbi:MAG: Hsp20/alpha crystallin family protein [Candidatus Thorarchaeota archaeon]
MMNDDFDDIIKKIKEYFKLDSDIFDVDFLFIPESDIRLGQIPDDKKVKGFKVTYHFETGMDKPEIKIEGDLDNKKIREYLKDVDLSKVRKLKNVYNSKSNNEIDASKLSLDFSQVDESDDIGAFLEPYTEICDNETGSEILIEIPGMSKDDVNIRLQDNGRKLVFNAEKKNRKYRKSIQLPFKSTQNDCEIEVINGLAIIKVRKENK